MVLTPETVKLMVDAVKYHRDHECQEGVHMGLYILYTLAGFLKNLMPHLPEYVQTWEPYKH